MVLLLTSLGVDAWLWWGDPALSYYCGLSGILNGLLIVGLVHLWRDTRHLVVLLTALVAVLKIFVEINTGQSLVTQTAWPSVPVAHAAGYLSGLVLAAGDRRRTDRSRRCRMARSSRHGNDGVSGRPGGGLRRSRRARRADTVLVATDMAIW